MSRATLNEPSFACTPALSSGASPAKRAPARNGSGATSISARLASIARTTAEATASEVLVPTPSGSCALPANPALYLGGLLGAFVVVVSLTAVQTLGVLRLGLAVVAGQTAGALVIDLVAPAPGEAVTAGTLVGVALTIGAVVVSGRGRRAR